jgi:perosamine synthetase
MIEKLGHKRGSFPICEYVAARTLALPFFTRMTARQVTQVCKTLEQVIEKTLVGRKNRF